MSYFTDAEQSLLLVRDFRRVWTTDFARFQEVRIENMIFRTKAIIGKNWLGDISVFNAVSVYRAHDHAHLCERVEQRDFNSVSDALAFLGPFAGEPDYPPVQAALPPKEALSHADQQSARWQ